MTTTRLPLPLRDALAELAIAGLEDATAAAALAWIADPHGPPPAPAAARLAALHLIDTATPALLAVHAPYAAAAASHATRALAARARFAPPPSAADPVVAAIRRAVALWDERLFFEVHEVLEAAWVTATGHVRQALQGLIQIAVAYHHLAHGNLRGARSLLAEGRQRLAGVPPGTLPDVDAVALLDATAPWLERLARKEPPGAEPPRLATMPHGSGGR
ncbi:MAG TPA: DUF309 domain-containing protein [Candidatus Binatia bacterium]|jgi:hypothetical protein|nr:DUF309 domain-containing protein [Candidatus Binatia bacterium]